MTSFSLPPLRREPLLDRDFAQYLFLQHGRWPIKMHRARKGCWAILHKVLGSKCECIFGAFVRNDSGSWNPICAKYCIKEEFAYLARLFEQSYYPY